MYRFHVPDMSCGHCASTITKAVKAEDAKATVSIDLERQTVEVESALPAEEIRRQLEEAGYAASLRP